MSHTDRRTFLAASAGLAAIALVPEVLRAAPRAADAVGVAVIGAGRQGRAIMAELQKLDAARVVVVCDRDEGRLRSGLGRAPGAEGLTSASAAITHAGVSAVIVATPTHEHRALVEEALAAGRHVYCEAPLASTVEDTTAIAAAAAKARSVFAAGFQARSNPVYRLARTFYRSDSVRDLIAMRAQDVSKTSWRLPVSDPAREREVNWRLDPAVSIGLAGELGSHQFDVCNWYLGAYPTEIRSVGSIRAYDDGRTMADTVQADLLYQGGARLQYLASLATSFESRHEVFFGSNATIKLAWSHGWMFKEADAPTQGWEVYANRQQFHRDEGITLIADATKLAAQGKLKEGIGLPNPSLYYALEDFLRSVIDGAEVRCDAVEGARSTIVGILAHHATVSGAAVAVDPALFPGA